MSYQNFASFYDEMMSDVDYSWWLSHFKAQLTRGGKILDVGCGTGTLAIELAKEGYQVTALDLSEDMLVIAKEKAQNANVNIEFVQQDMRLLNLHRVYDGVILSLDVINYLKNPAEVKATFNGVFKSLKPNGMLIFDAHTPKKIATVFDDYLYVENRDDLTYIWHVEQANEPMSIIHELTVFFRQADGSYARFIEHHYQRTYSPDHYTQWLIDCNFTDIIEDGDDLRQRFTARKGEKNEENI